MLSVRVVVVLVLMSSLGKAAEWPRFRGPNADGVADGSRIPARWATDQNVDWQVNVPGEGWSAPIVANGKVIVTTAVSEGGKDKNSRHRWEIHCLDQATGSKLWSKVAKEGQPGIGTHRANTYASETPVTDGEHIVAYFGMTGLYCYDYNGEQLWAKDLGVYEMRNGWGTSSSPAMHEGMVFVQVDNEGDSFLVALDVKSGAEKWRVAREESSNWGSPIIWKNSVRAELVTVGQTVRSYDPATGKVLWSLDAKLGGVCSSPATAGDLLLVGASGRGGQGGGLWAVQAGATGELTDGNGIAWSNLQTGPQMSSPLVYQGHVYILARDGGIVNCLDALTGTVVYRERLPNAGQFWASPWACDGHVFLPDADGKTFVLEPGSQFKVVGHNQLEGQFWASVAIANGRLILRSTDTLFCIANDD